MRIKHLYLVLLMSIPSVIAHAQSSYSIEGKIDKLKTGTRIFLVFQDGDKQVADSAIVSKGRFTFKGTLQYPVRSRLFLHKNPYVRQLAKGEKLDYFDFYMEAVAMKMAAHDSLKHIAISGSPINKDFSTLKGMLAGNDKKYGALQKEFSALPQDQQQDKDIRDRFVTRENELVNEMYHVYLDFAKANPDSYLSVVSLAQIAAEPSMSAEAGKAYQLLNDKLKKTPLGQSIPVAIASYESTQIGRFAPDFEQKTPEGKAIKLSDFKGKYVLLDFWASWCGPCREENPNVVAAYDAYKGKGFEVLGVSLDGAAQRTAWIKAIEKDSLSWTQVSDLKSWDNEAARAYGVRSIPANFLIDPTGKIVARNLRGEDLQKTLNTYIK